MPSLINFRTVIGRSSLIAAIVDDAFESVCLELITVAYGYMKTDKQYSNQWKETRFSALLMKYMRQVRDESDLAIKIDPEVHLYREAILDGLEDPDTADRIDIRLMGAWIKEDVYYGIEGKVLVQHDWQSRKASTLRRRYIHTGIDNYKNNNYGSAVTLGCIVGYVVEGKASIIANQINQLLTRYHRKAEKLVDKRTINSCDCCYTSHHTRTKGDREFRITHLLIDCL